MARGNFGERTVVVATDPTPEEIAEQTAAIRALWTHAVERKRQTVQEPPHWTVPTTEETSPTIRRIVEDYERHDLLQQEAPRK